MGIPHVTGPVALIAIVYLTSVGLLHMRHVDDVHLLAPPSNPAVIARLVSRSPAEDVALSNSRTTKDVSELSNYAR